MGSRKHKCCIYSSISVDTYNRTGIRPECASHEHISSEEAFDLTGCILFSKTMPDGSLKATYEFDWVRRCPLDKLHSKLQAIYCTDPRKYIIRKSGGRMGVEVHMLVKTGS